MIVLRRITGILLATLLLAGCAWTGSTIGSSNGHAANATPSPACAHVLTHPDQLPDISNLQNSGNPAILIVAPAPGATVRGPNIVITYEVFNMTVTPPIGQENNFRQGYVQLYLDNSRTAMRVQPVAPGGASTTFTNVAPGSHTVCAELHQNDRTLFATPQAVMAIQFTVTASS